MKYLSVCSGIEAATVAWHPLGWEPAGFSEIAKFPSALLQHYYPKVPNHGSLTEYRKWKSPAVDLLIGGTPCQSFSLAGLRKGLVDPRGNLALAYVGAAQRFKPRWVVWENVPGVLSTNGGRDFGSIIGGLAKLGYGVAYRVLDAQFFGVAQQRRRVIVVGYLGDWRRAAAVLFERAGLRGDPPPSRAKGKEITGALTANASGGGGYEEQHEKQWPAEVAPTLTAAFGDKLGLEDQHALTGAGLFVPEIVGALTAKGPEGYGAPEVDAGHYILSSAQGQASIRTDHAPTMTADSDPAGILVEPSARRVRRITPREAERLQGFPDDYTLIPYPRKPAKDAPRYTAIGNSMAVPKIRWLGERIALVDAMLKGRKRLRMN